ncbi:hypothetical protein ACIBKX_16925 [Streptomyces sp. NPDC050658]|uniref:hypothetical protein n=1 Tax=unclassified Streptomyces TaxID=2593676 RepID=UPI003419DE08
MVWLKRNTRRTLGIVAATGAVLALAACGQGESAAQGSANGKTGDREARYKRVIEDPHPKPADVVWAAGAPSGVARADDGSLLLTYDAGNVEDDEGPAATAWRIVAPDGRMVAEDAEHTDAEAARVQFRGGRGGFVRVPPGEGSDGVYALDVQGKRHEVTVKEKALATRAGDVLLTESEPTLVYRPGTHTAAPPVGVPDDAHRLAVDERGTTWSLVQPLTEEPNSVAWRGGGNPEGSTRVLPKPYVGGKIAARGGTAAVSLIKGERTRGLLVTTDGGADWRTVTGGGIPWQDLKGPSELLTLEALSDGRLLVGEDRGRLWLADDPSNRGFHPLKTPKKFTSITVHGTTLYGIVDATTSTYDLVDGEGLWTSDDGGEKWTRFGGHR